jgi:hypothetical protein
MKSFRILSPSRFATAAALILTCTAAFAGSNGKNSRPKTTTVKNIQSAYTWNMTHDTATGSGVSTGTMALVSSPSLSGAARQFGISFQNSAGERYWSTFGSDTAATNFTYDTWVYIASPSSDIANLEFDMNQVMANGQTVIFGVQCDGYSSTWDYTTNAGTPDYPVDQWLHSTAPCNPQKWATNTWHHVIMNYSRDSVGNVTYQTISLDGLVQQINETVPSAFALRWATVLLTNFQIDGLGAYGSATVYLDRLTISRW